MASIRKRGTSWQVQIRRRSNPPLCRTFRSKKDGEIWARMVEARLDRTGLPGDYRELKRMKLADLLVRYRDQVTPRKRSAENETYRINKLLRHPISAQAVACHAWGSQVCQGSGSLNGPEKPSIIMPMISDLDIRQHGERAT